MLTEMHGTHIMVHLFKGQQDKFESAVLLELLNLRETNTILYKAENNAHIQLIYQLIHLNGDTFFFNFLTTL